MELVKLVDKALILFGGTFDPLHFGHLKIATGIYELFHNRVTFLPTNVPNYKMNATTSAVDRLAMLKLALSHDERYVIDTSELERSNYTCAFDTLSYFRNKLGDTLPIFFIIGSDSLYTSDQWERWQDLFELTNFIVVARPHYSIADIPRRVQDEYLLRNVATFDYPYPSSGTCYKLDIPLINISSTDIRAMVKTNQDISIFVPSAIKDYIYSRNLYLSCSSKKIF